MKNTLIKIAVCMSAFELVGSGLSQTITIAGPDSLVELGRMWADTYNHNHADTHLQVEGARVSAAFSALQTQKAEVALVPRAIRFKEADACTSAFGQRPVELKVAVNGSAVFVNGASPVKVLTYEELFGIFKGKVRNWKEVGGSDAAITVYGEQTNSAVAELFLDEVLNGKELAADVRLVSAAELPKAIAKDVNAIGYGCLSTNPGVRALDIKRVVSSTPVEATADNIASRIYPVSRFVYCYLNPSLNQGKLKAWLDWIRTDEGQRVVQQLGFYPLPAKFRTTP
jgi:phosphate transport system substrate-binding protein